MLRRIHRNIHGCKSIVLRCESRLQNTGIACRARTVNEVLLQDIILKAINEIILDKSGYMKILQENIDTVIHNDAIAEEIFQLRELKEKSEIGSVIRDEKLARITEFCDFLKEQSSKITVFDESLVRRMLQKITVFEDHFTVGFKSGISVDIEG